MRITRPCIRPEQLSFLSSAEPPFKRHRWKNGFCIHCSIDKNDSIFDGCDCGCRVPIVKETPTTHYGKHTFVFGHETLDMFEGNQEEEKKQG